MKKIQILFFGKLKDLWKTSSITIETDSNSVDELYENLLKDIDQTPFKPSIKVAINDEFSHWGAIINDGDVIAFLPPASGG